MSDKSAAYLLFSFTEPDNMQGFGDYATAADAIMDKFGGELLVAGAKDAAISKFEGQWPNGTGLTLIRFPSRQHLEDFWASEDYQAIAHLRTNILTPNFTIGFSNAWRGDVAG